MSRNIPPGKPGYDASEFATHMVYVGLQLARDFGTGEALIPHLQAHFPTVEPDLIQAAANQVTQGAFAAQQNAAGDRTQPLNLEPMPVLPGGFFLADEADRVLSISTVTFQTADDPTPDNWMTITRTSENLTFDELEQLIRQQFRDCVEWTDPVICEKIINEQISVYFQGRRF